MRCDFEVIEIRDGERLLRCRNCRQPDMVVREPQAKAARPCKGTRTEKHEATIAKRPGIVERARSLATAYAKWKAAGKPTRSQEQIDALLIICQACEHLKDGACNKCGCPVNRKQKWGNKLAWATESCPLTPPKWSADQ